MNEKEYFECSGRTEPAKTLQKPRVCLGFHDDVVPYGAIELEMSCDDAERSGEKQERNRALGMTRLHEQSATPCECDEGSDRNGCPAPYGRLAHGLRR